ncbi:hypothetical protein [Lysinibacillus xylanilyticus]|uniref:Uncharacterized protein n=1 Tax=Lysinibacillus xylanilyticus TaxID=582475 RepID=A0ABT4EX15_9BACI|nr:hypothetical protein [Lysinibacillus xylanilyticus]MCY9549603.1 hypothetical protein [Lysinibacillus xylanilyticus]
MKRNISTVERTKSVVKRILIMFGEAVVTDIPEPESAMPDMSGMGGMPGMM